MKTTRFLNIMSLFAILAFTACFTHSAVAGMGEDAVVHVLLDQISTRSEAEERRKIEEEVRKLPKDEQRPALEAYERIRREFTFAIEAGMLSAAPISPASLNLRSGEFFALHEDSPVRLFMWVKIPWFFHSANLTYTKIRGDADYELSGANAGQFTGHFPLVIQKVALEYGLRLKPLHGRFKLQPFAEAGFGFGWAGVTFADSARTQLAPQGSDYRLHEDLAAFGYYFKGGLELDLINGFGLSAAFRYAKDVSTPAKTLGAILQANQSITTLGVHWRF